MRTLVIAAAAAAATAAYAATETYRVERDTETGETLLVGADGARRPFRMLTEEEYAQVAGLLERANSTEQGRVLVHGRRVKPVLIDDEGMHVAYEDGYVHTEKAAPRAVPLVKREFADRARRPTGPERLRRIIEAREAAKRPKEVRVDYDANTGKHVDRGEVR